MDKKKSSIIQTSVGLGILAVLSVIVSIDILSANQPSLTERLIMVGGQWGIFMFLVFLAVRYYRKIDDWDMDYTDDTDNLRSSNDKKD